MHNPELFILDDPFSVLDSVNANLLSSIIESRSQLKKQLSCPFIVWSKLKVFVNKFVYCMRERQSLKDY